jgi:membrane protease YdiL (CAAX protease family)
MNEDPSSLVTPELMQQNPHLIILSLALSGWFILLIVGSLVAWGWLTVRKTRGHRWLTVEPWTPRKWGLLDFLIICFAAILCQSIAARIGYDLLDMERPAVQGEEGSFPIGLVTLISVGNLVAMLLGIGWICLRFGEGLRHVGFTSKRSFRHLMIGGVAMFAIIPPTYLMMAVVSLGLDKEYKHPLIEAMSADGGLQTFVLGAFTAAILAPVTEEFLFRVIIQGGLQSLPFRSWWRNLLGGFVPANSTSIDTDQRQTDHGQTDGESSPAWLYASSQAPAGHPSEASLSTEQAVGHRRPLDSGVVEPGVSAAADGSVRTETRSDAGNSEESNKDIVAASLVPPLWPAIVTGILFGLAHWGYGFSFLPLMVLGIGLGLLYRATHSIWPSLLVHFALNATSMLALGVSLAIEQAAK